VNTVSYNSVNIFRVCFLLILSFLSNIMTHYMQYLKFHSEMFSLPFVFDFYKVYTLISFKLSLKTVKNIFTVKFSIIIYLTCYCFIGVMQRVKWTTNRLYPDFSLISDAVFLSCSVMEMTVLCYCIICMRKIAIFYKKPLKLLYFVCIRVLNLSKPAGTLTLS
jgi:hypothetical protein